MIDSIFELLQVIQALVSLINEPEPEHPLRGDLVNSLISWQFFIFIQCWSLPTKKFEELSFLSLLWTVFTFQIFHSFFKCWCLKNGQTVNVQVPNWFSFWHSISPNFLNTIWQFICVCYKIRFFTSLDGFKKLWS